jgi:hypothetical protein
MVFGDRMLGRVFGLKRNEIMRGFILHAPYQTILRVTKSRRMDGQVIEGTWEKKRYFGLKSYRN